MTETQRKAMQQALEALEFFRGTAICDADTKVADEGITALCAALAEPEPEQVAWMAEEWQQRVEQMRAEAMAYKEAYFRLVEMIAKSKAMEPGCPVFLAAPPARKPLTHPQIHELDWPDDVAFEDILEFARAIERAHGITGEDDE